jgi:hypothetical protein
MTALLRSCRAGAVLACVLIPGAGMLLAQPYDSAAVLEKARAVAREMIAMLPKYTCSATVNRTYLTETRRTGKTCDDIVAGHRRGRAQMEKTATDRLRLDVEVADGGYEIFSWPGAGRIDSEKIEDFASGGPIGTGPFGPFLIDIFDNNRTTFDYLGDKIVDGRPVLEYRFRVPLEGSHYKIVTGFTSHYIGYDGQFRLDPASSQLIGLEVRTDELPRETQSCESSTSVEFQSIRIGQGEYFIPRQSTLQFIGKYGDDSESVTTYSACREFHGEAAIAFDPAEAQPDSNAPQRKPPATVLPPGLPVRLAFETQIDTDVAAAGDPLIATVVSAVKQPGSNNILLEAGTKISGRIVHMEHHIRDKDYFLVSVEFDSLNVVVDAPKHVVDPVKQSGCWGSLQQVENLPYGHSTSERIESHGRLVAGGIFVLPSKNGRDVTPKGCKSNWITVPAQH